MFDYFNKKMEFEKEEDFIFPVPRFNEKILPEYKNYLINIPTERKTEDNKEEVIPCLFKKCPNSNILLIFFHCNASDIFLSFLLLKQIIEKYKLNLLIPEYPSYSLYKSPKSSQKCLDNSLIIYDFCLQNIKNISEKNIYILGRSLGTGPAIYLSSKRNPAGTFLISPYSTFANVGKNHDEKFYNKLTKHFPSINYIDKIECPLCIFHGKEDYLISYDESKKLFDKCEKNNKKELYILDNMGHNDFFEYIKDMKNLADNFIEKYCPFDKNQNNYSLDLDKRFYYYNDDIKE